MAVGNSFAFIEPLESTGLHLILRHLRKLAIELREGVTPATPARYSASINNLWDHVKSFVAMHFKFNARQDSPFWRMCRSDIDVSALDEYLDYYRENGPVSDAPDHPLHERLNLDNCFPPFSYDMALAGCGLNRDYFRTRTARVSDAWPQRHKLDRILAGRALGHRAGLAAVTSGACTFVTGDMSYI